MQIIGFNSGNYDINLSKDFGLINYLLGDKGVERLAGEGWLIIDVDDEGVKIEDTQLIVQLNLLPKETTNILQFNHKNYYGWI